MAKFLKNLGRAQKKLCGKKSLSVKHSYNNSVSVYRNNDEKHPIITISADGEYKISILKLIMIILGVFSAAALLLLTVKKITKFKQRKLLRDPSQDELYAYPDDDCLPF